MESYKKVLFQENIADGFESIKDSFKLIGNDYTTNCSDSKYYSTLITREPQNLNILKSVVEDISNLYYIPASDLYIFININK